jgi:hypothetical protein
MAWWAWVLTGWVLLSIVGAFAIGALAGRHRDRERTLSGLDYDEEFFGQQYDVVWREAS